MAEITITEFQADYSPQAANKALILALKCRAQADHCAVLWFRDIYDRQLYKELGYSSIYLYGEKELGLSQSRTGDFKRLAEKLKELPALQKEMEEGKIGYTKAREIIKVAQPDNEDEWVGEAHKSTRDELAQKVKRAREDAEMRRRSNPAQGQLLISPPLPTPAAAMTHKVTLEMTTAQLARYENLWEKLHKQGSVQIGSKKVEILLEAVVKLADSTGNTSKGKKPSASPVQIHVHQCPDCDKATITTNRGDVPLAKRELEHLSCDAQILESGKPNRATIPPSVKREVFSRAHHRCQTPGCRNTRFLEVHHIQSRNHGGSNNLENLKCLCSACHAQMHFHAWRPGKCPPGVVNPTKPAVYSATPTSKPLQPSRPVKYGVRE